MGPEIGTLVGSHDGNKNSQLPMNGVNEVERAEDQGVAFLTEEYLQGLLVFGLITAVVGKVHENCSERCNWY